MGSLDGIPSKAHDVFAVADDQVGIGPVNDEGVALDGGINHRVFVAFVLPHIDGREVTRRELSEVAQLDIGETAVVIDVNWNQPRCFGAAGGIVVLEVVVRSLRSVVLSAGASAAFLASLEKLVSAG